MSTICVRAVFSCAIVLNSLFFLILSSPVSDPHDLVSIATNQSIIIHLLVFSFYFIKVLDYRTAVFFLRLQEPGLSSGKDKLCHKYR